MNNKKVADYLQKHFVCVAGNDVSYVELPNAAKEKGEYKFLNEALRVNPKGIYQGVFTITPSGKWLKKVDTGWPVYDPEACLENLKSARRRYDNMLKSQRLAERALPETARSMRAYNGIEAPVGTMKMRSVARSFDFKDMHQFDARHSSYYGQDYLWFSREETATLLPSSLKVGAKQMVGNVVTKRLLLHAHVMLGSPAWQQHHLKSVNMTTEVVKVQGHQVYLNYSGEFSLDGRSRYINSAYDGELLGRGVWDKSSRKFTKLEWVTLGNSNQRTLPRNLNRGNTHITKVGAMIRLIGEDEADINMPPHHYKYQYPRAWKMGIGR